MSQYRECLKAVTVFRLEKRILEGIMIVYFKYLEDCKWVKINVPEGENFGYSNG